MPTPKTEYQRKMTVNGQWSVGFAILLALLSISLAVSDGILKVATAVAIGVVIIVLIVLRSDRRRLRDGW